MMLFVRLDFDNDTPVGTLEQYNSQFGTEFPIINGTIGKNIKMPVWPEEE